MNLSHQASAKIYQFPVGGRASLRKASTTSRPVFGEVAMPRNAALTAGESWYHAEAIEAEKDSKPA